PATCRACWRSCSTRAITRGCRRCLRASRSPSRRSAQKRRSTASLRRWRCSSPRRTARPAKCARPRLRVINRFTTKAQRTQRKRKRKRIKEPERVTFTLLPPLLLFLLSLLSFWVKSFLEIIMENPQPPTLLSEMGPPGRRPPRLPECDVPTAPASELLPADAQCDAPPPL